jgi:hypothetical protein
MNKRLIKLFRLSGGTISVSEDAILTFTDNFNPAKFADLIIRECLIVVEDKCDDTYDGDGFHIGEFCGSLMYSIEEHFGIKE